MPEGKLSVLMPAYNEGRHIYRNVEETRRVLRDIGVPFEILVIDDRSTDDTASEAARAAGDFEEVRLKRGEENQGKGWALKSGFKASTGELVAFVDSDLDIHPDQLKLYLDLMAGERADVVVASKRHPGSVLVYPSHRRAISGIYFRIVRFLFGLPIRDTQTGLKLFRREVLERVFHRTLVKRWAFDLELLAVAHHLGYRIVEAPVRIHFQRRFGRMRFRDLYYTGLDTLAVFYRLRILRFYDRTFERTKRRPKASVILPIQEIPADLEARLARCLRLDYPDFEVLLLPDEAIRHLSPGVRVIPTGRIGPAAKKNFGAGRARGELLAFLDPGHQPTVDWLSDGAANFDSEDVAAVAGPELVGEGAGRAEAFLSRLHSSLMVSGPGLHQYSPRRHRDIPYWPGGALILRTEAWRRAGGFPESSEPGWENAHLSGHLTRHERRRVVYDPDVMTYVRTGLGVRGLLRRIGRHSLVRFRMSRGGSCGEGLFGGGMMVLTLLLAIGWVPALWWPRSGGWYGTIWMGYGVLCLGAAGLRRKPAMLLPIALGIVILHFAEGLALWRGLLTGESGRLSGSPVSEPAGG